MLSASKMILYFKYIVMVINKRKQLIIRTKCYNVRLFPIIKTYLVKILRRKSKTIFSFTILSHIYNQCLLSIHFFSEKYSD